MKNLLFLVMAWTLVWIVESDCCAKFQNDKCVQCPNGMHLYRDNCIYDIKNCLSYKDGFECEKCRPGYNLTGNKCIEPDETSNQSANVSTPSITPIQNISSSTPNTNPPTIKDYKVTPIDFRNLKTITNLDLVDQFTISDQIFRSSNPIELKNADVMKAEQRTYPNGTVHVAIDYKNVKNEVYNSTIEVNLKTFVFRVIEFGVFEDNKKEIEGKNESKDSNNTSNNSNGTTSSVPPQSSLTITFTSYNPTFTFPLFPFTSSELDLTNSSQLQLMALLDQQVTTYLNEELKNLPQKKIRKVDKAKNSSIVVEVTEMGRIELRRYQLLGSKKEYVVIQYHTNDSEVEYVAIGEIATGTQIMLPVKLVYAGFDKEKLANKSSSTSGGIGATGEALGTATTTNTTNNTSPSTPPVPHLQYTQVKDDLQLLNDIYYMISKDQLSKKHKQYDDLTPDKVFIASLEKSTKNSTNFQIPELMTVNYYKLVFGKDDIDANGKNDAVREVVVRCNVSSYEAEVVGVTHIGTTGGSSNQSASTNSPSIATPTNNSSSTSTSTSTSNPPSSSPLNTPTPPSPIFPIPSGFTPTNPSFTSNVYYLIAMNTLASIDKKYTNIQPVQVYIKNETNSVKIELLFKFMIQQKDGSRQAWKVVMEVFQSSFRASLVKNEVVGSSISQNDKQSLKQQSDQTESLNKTEVSTNSTNSNKNSTGNNNSNSTKPIISDKKNATTITPIAGRVVLLRDDKDRILMEVREETEEQWENKNSRRNIETQRGLRQQEEVQQGGQVKIGGKLRKENY